MSISLAFTKGTTVFIKDESGKIIFQVPVGSGPNDGLKGYTSSSVSVQKGSTIFTYNAMGRVASQSHV